jgi:hypothetical protein
MQNRFLQSENARDCFHISHVHYSRNEWLNLVLNKMTHVANLAQVKDQQKGDLSCSGWSSVAVPEGLQQMH